MSNMNKLISEREEDDKRKNEEISRLRTELAISNERKNTVGELYSNAEME